MTDHSDLLDSLAKPPPAPSALDELMSRDPDSLSAKDIDDLIAMYRQQRAQRAAGGPRTRKKPDTPTGPTLTLEELGFSKPKPATTSTFIRRV